MSEKDGSYYLYDLNVFYVTKVLKTVDDFKYVSVQGGDKMTNPTITGYYILGNDIDCGGAKISASRATQWNVDLVGFRGVFDGNGKTISNAKMGESGLFGQVGREAVIKNVTFDNITFTGTNNQRTTLFGNMVSNATLQNITVNIVSYAVSIDTSKGAPYVEQGLFGGTENVLGIASLGNAIELFNYKDSTARDYVWDNIADIDGIYLIGAKIPKHRLVNNLYICVRSVNGQELVGLMDDLYNTQISTGSACNNGEPTPSFTLLAIGIPEEDIHSCIRISFKGNETEEQLCEFCKNFRACINILRSY
jgi:uncharacterized protein YjbI with pentapeptide repeats